jgi:uncharacterized protein
MRIFGLLALAATIVAAPAQAGFFLDRSPSGIELAQTEYPVLRPRAEGGNAANAYMVGLYLYFGVGVERDRVAGLNFIRQAAEGDIAGAQYMLGFLYGSGLGPRTDLAESKKWYDAADAGWTAGGPDWRMKFSFGEGTFAISAANIRAYEEAANAGDLAAQLRMSFFLGTRFFRSGRGQDGVDAIKWTQRAAEREHPSALNNLAIFLANGIGMPRDEVRAVELFRRSAEAGVPEARMSLALTAASGSGVERNAVEAVRLFKIVAEEGNPVAQIALAFHYARGDGIARDYAQTLAWLIRASDRGCAIEQSLIGVGVGMLIEDLFPAEYQTQKPEHGPCN